MSYKKLAGLALILTLAACSSTVELPPPSSDSSEQSEATVAPVVQEAGTDQSMVVEVTPEAPATPQMPDISSVERLVYFDYDSYVLKPEFQSMLDAHASYLRMDPKIKVVIEGHTDERGGREYNLALGQRRAEAVRRALELLGVADGQIEAVSFGKEKPAAAGSNEDAWAKNRRAEIVYR